MRRINSPRPDQENSVAACCEAVEPALMQLMERAEQAGWSRGDVVFALARLVAAHEARVVLESSDMQLAV